MNLPSHPPLRRTPWSRAFARLAAVCLLGACLLVGCEDMREQARAGRTFTLVAPGSSYLALQDGAGAWQMLSEPRAGHSLSTVTLTDPQGRFGIASLCHDEVGGGLSVQVHYGVVAAAKNAATGTVTETITLANRKGAERVPLVELPCATPMPPPGEALTVRAEVQGLKHGEYSSVYLGNASALVDASASASGLELRSTISRPDLIATRYRPGAQVPSALFFAPNLALDPVGMSTVEINFASLNMTDIPDVYALESAALPVEGLRPGELLSGSVELLSASGTRALLGEYTGEDALRYARPPEPVLRGAALRAEVQSFAYNDRTKAGSSRSVSRTFAGGVTEALALPPPLALEPPLLVAAGEGVRPHASWENLGRSAGRYTQFYSQVRDGRNVSYRVSQSLPYLRLRFPESTTFSQTLPDLSVLPDWPADARLLRAADLFWDVSFSTEGEGYRAFSSRSGVLNAP